MSPVAELDDYRAHAVVQIGVGHPVHVVPLRLVEDLVAGRLGLDDLEGRDDLIRALLADWLRSVRSEL